jgi:outer membrane lipoprotein-sorting protein
MRPQKRLENEIKRLIYTVDGASRDKMLDLALENLEDRLRPVPAARRLNLGRIIMTKRRIVAAAILMAAVGLGVYLFTGSATRVTAAEILAEASSAMANLKSVHIKLQMRAPEGGDNFRTIGLDYDFVPVEIWKQFDDAGPGKWRMENLRRVHVMDGQSTVCFIRPNHAYRSGPQASADWLPLSLVDVDKIIEREAALAASQGSDYVMVHHQGPDGRDKLVVSVEAKAQGDFTNDYLKNKGIEESDHCRVYTFDSQTKLLEAFQLTVHGPAQDVVVLQIGQVEYDKDLDPGLFALELPANVVWYKDPEVLADNAKYEAMGPKESATAFFQACSQENWDEVLKFWSASAVDQSLKDSLGGIEVVSIGEPFKSGNYPGWFVPYEIRFKSGGVKKFNLAIRNDNPAKRYVVDGGI